MSNYSDSSFDYDNTNSSWAKAFEMIPEHCAVLDIGCSSGHFGKELIDRKGCSVDGIEIDSADYAKAKKVLGSVYQLNIETDDLSIIKSKYDIVYLGDVIEHLYNPVKTLERLKKLLNKNGSIVFSLPNMAYLAVRLLLIKGDFDYTETGLLDKTHIHFYNIKEVNRVFSEAGYNIGKIDFVKKDYPDDVMKDYLDSVGLVPKKKFLDMMRKPDAAAFQFVGLAKVGEKQIQVLDDFGPVDMFENYYVGEKNRYIKIISDITKSRDNLKSDALKWRRFRANPVKFVVSKLFKI